MCEIIRLLESELSGTFQNSKVIILGEDIYSEPILKYLTERNISFDIKANDKTQYDIALILDNTEIPKELKMKKLGVLIFKNCKGFTIKPPKSLKIIKILND